MSELYIGIDPGLHGAVAAIRGDLDPDHVLATSIFDAPVVTIKKGSRTSELLDPARMAGILRELASSGRFPIAAIERAQSSPRMGVGSAFSYGVGYGTWIGILAALKIPYATVRPQEWMAVMFAGSGSRDKALSIATANRLFPRATFTKKGDHGRAEALLIAEWLRRSKP